MLRILIAIVVLAAPRPALAWWDYGHRVIASIAWAELTPATRAEIAALLAAEADVATPTCPLASIEDASVWPDCIKTLGDRYSYAFSWHFQNVDVCKPFDDRSACAGGNCVSAQIDRNARLLADRALPARVRLEAFAFLVHFIGDMHMPLHAGDRGDRGGNDVVASYGYIAGRTNLHLMWDGYLAERSITTPPGGPTGLLAGLGTADKAAIAAGSTRDWAREAWAASRELAYAGLLGEACAPLPAERPVLREAATRQLIPAVRQQVVRAGLRLARTLDAALRT